MKIASSIALSFGVGLLAACAPPGPPGSSRVEATPTAAPARALTPALTSALTPAPRPVVEVPAGAHLDVIVGTSMSSKTSQPGDRIEGRLGHDLVVNNVVVARAGNAVRGQITAAVPAGRVKTRARLAFIFDTLVVEGGAAQPIETHTVDITADDTHTRDAVTVGGSAGAGAIIGAIVGGGKGAGIGALIGAGAGTGVILVDKGKNVNIAAGGTLTIQLTQPLRVRT